ncbi:hypothetical protein N9L06_04605, partial [Mariniblastus sp.]|nr:hypothetical protein [Mariniblastus sp.]
GGQLIIGGDLIIEGTLNYELGSSSEAIQVGIAATLPNGDLVVDTAASFTPTADQTFVLLEADSGIFGEFEDVTFSNVPDGLQYEIVYSDNTVELVVSAIALLGDFEPDGDVDADDIDFFSGLVTANNDAGTLVTAVNAQLDLDANGTINSEDLRIHVETLVQTSNGRVGTFFGDANLDGTVDVLGDAFILVANLNGPGGWAEADFNQDGRVTVLGDAFSLVANLRRSNTP